MFSESPMIFWFSCHYTQSCNLDKQERWTLNKKNQLVVFQCYTKVNFYITNCITYTWIRQEIKRKTILLNQTRALRTSPTWYLPRSSYSNCNIASLRATIWYKPRFARRYYMVETMRHMNLGLFKLTAQGLYRSELRSLQWKPICFDVWVSILYTDNKKHKKQCFSYLNSSLV